SGPLPRQAQPHHPVWDRRRTRARRTHLPTDLDPLLDSRGHTRPYRRTRSTPPRLTAVEKLGMVRRLLLPTGSASGSAATQDGSAPTGGRLLAAFKSTSNAKPSPWTTVRASGGAFTPGRPPRSSL